MHLFCGEMHLSSRKFNFPNINIYGQYSYISWIILHRGVIVHAEFENDHLKYEAGCILREMHMNSRNCNFLKISDIRPAKIAISRIFMHFLQNECSLVISNDHFLTQYVCLPYICKIVGLI